MDWEAELAMALRAILAAVLGGFIGWQRELERRAAGVRTYAAVSLGSCIFSLVSNHLAGAGASQDRIAAQVVTGIGFLGAGVIIKEQGRVKGLTTAATLWATAAVGMAIAYSMFVLGGLGAVIIFGLLSVHQLPGWGKLVGEGTDEDSSENPRDQMKPH